MYINHPLTPRHASAQAQPWIKRLIASLVVLVFIEVFLMNFRFWESLTFGESATPSIASIGEGLLAHDDGSYTVTDPDRAFVEYADLGRHIDNVELDLDVPGWAPTSWRDSSGPYLMTRLEANDESSADLITLPKTTYARNNTQSHWTRIHLSGKSQRLRLTVKCPKGTELTIGQTRINSVRPFLLSPARILALAICMFLFQLLRPSSRLYSTDMFDGKLSKRLVVIFVCAAEIVVTVFVGSIVSNGEIGAQTTSGATVYDFNQYNHLADALSAGRVSLDLPVASSLKSLDNPYDSKLREETLSRAGETYYLDYAYYKGKYYSYFGVLPALTLFLPYKAITGYDLSTARAVVFMGAVYILAMNHLLLSLGRALRVRMSIGTFLLASLSMVTSSGFLYLIYLPQLYSLPILMGLSTLFAGLGIWLREEAGSGARGYRIWALAGGSFLIACCLLCRPQYFLAVALALPLFWDAIIKRRAFFSRRGLGNTLAVILPCLLVATVAMAYNFTRFASPIDFGATYNLTGSDMTHRSIDLARCIPATFQYLFQPISLCARFPYILAANMAVDYQGYWFFEPYLGGAAWFCPLIFTLFGLRSHLRGKSGLSVRLVPTLVILAAVILFVDFQVASVTTRYFNDFMWLLILATWTVSWDGAREKSCGCPTYLILLASAGCALNVLALFAEGHYAPMSLYCPSLFTTLRTWLYC
ncbi:hypothetical protein [Olsenella sp. HMSC062G07]|uniref:hypothetical protein n=1 Tax=Olsenella sp. HMSC062G07 TaxID=1739330 RepID=UPI0008A37AD2|nr:hypothetical protein [Olsenella sp. HMSC062G07]OFK23332.1 hypothetical protein HMPREF2826_05340 [Olsenella sp. HMSC062G07]